MRKGLEGLFERHKGKACTLIETGTYNGVGVVSALKAGFEGVVSFEIVEHLALTAHNKFKNTPNVLIINDSSSGVQFKIICNNLKEPCVFWLDAHKMGGDGVIPEDYPLIEELKAIGASPIQHTVLMDDFRLFPRYGVEIVDVIRLLSKGEKGYLITKDTVRDRYHNDVLCFTPGETG